MSGSPDWEISWQAAHRAETSSGPRSCISSMKTATPRPVSEAMPPRSESSSTRSISMSPESARPWTAGTVMPGFHRSRSFVAVAATALRRLALALGEGLDDAERVVPRAAGRAELADRLVQGRGERAPQRLVGPGLELAGPPPGAHGRGAQRVEQHGLADPAQPGEDDRALGTAAGDPLEDDVEGVELLVATRELGRALAGAGGVGVPDRVHDRSVCGSLRFPADITIQADPRVAPLRGVLSVRCLPPSSELPIRSDTPASGSRLAWDPCWRRRGGGSSAARH